MKKFFAVLIWLFGTIVLLTSCSSNKNPSCELTLTSTEASVSYTLSFADLSKKQTSYKIEILKGETSVKNEVSTTDITAGQFSNLDLNTNYVVKVYVSNKAEYDVCLATKDIQTKKGTLTGVALNSQSFVYDGKAKSLEVSNLPDGATVSYTGNEQTEAGEYTVTATVKKDNYNDLVLTAKLSITQVSSDFVIADKTVTYTGETQTLTATTDLEVSYEYYLGETKLESAPVDAGIYTVKAIYAGDKNHAKIEKTATLTINKATYDMSSVAFTNASFAYDGTEHELLIKGTLPKGVTVRYENNKLTNAGSSTAKAIFTGDTTNYDEIAPMEATLTITKATTVITASDISIKFGESYDVVATCSLAGANLTLEYYQGETKLEAKPTSIGSYTVKISYAGNENYASSSKTIALFITNPENQDVTITLNDITTVYNQAYEVNPTADHNVAASDLTIKYFKEDGTEVAEKPVNAGVYEIRISYAGDDAKFLNPASKTVKLTINKANYDMSAVSFENVTYTYDGSEKTIVLTGTLPTGVTVLVYTSNTGTNAGSYKAAVSFTCADTDNYNAVSDMTATLTINKATPSTEGLQLNYVNDYTPNMTAEIFQARLEGKKIFLADYTKVLASGENKIKALYKLGSNYNDVEVEVTLECKKQLVDFELLAEGKQISGREFDKGVIAIKYLYNDGTSEIVEKPSFTTNTISNTSTAFTVEVTITDTNYKLDNKTKSIEITPIEAPDVMIYAVYGAGGNSGATYKNDFIILYNPTDQAIDLTGWSVQYASGTSASVSNSKTNIGVLNGTIQAYGFFTIIAGEVKESSTGAYLPFSTNADTTCGLTIGGKEKGIQIFLSTTKAPVAVNSISSSSCVDLLGTITKGTNGNPDSNPIASDGTPITYVKDTASYYKRKMLKDTNDNSTDFEIVSFNGSNDFDYLAKGHRVYNYAKTILDNQNLDFDALPDTFNLPMSYDGTAITWTTENADNLSIAVDGTVTVSKATDCDGKLIGSIAGYPLGFEYNVFISNKTRLDAPQVALSHFTLTWTTVTNAASYDIYINGVKYTNTTALTYDLYDGNFASNFTEKKSYDITIVAKCVDGSPEFVDSLASEEVNLNFADTSDLNNLTNNQVYTIKAVVTVKAAGTKNSFFVRDVDSSQGLLVYNYSSGMDFFTTVQPGQVIFITGEYNLRSKSPQLQNIKGTTITAETEAIDSITTSSALINSDFGRPISLENAVVISEFENNLLKVSVGENEFNLYPNGDYVNDVDTIKGLLPGNTLNFVGGVGKYNDTLQVYLTGYNVTSTDVSAEYKLEKALPEAVAKIKTSYTSGEVVNDLLASGTAYSDVSFTYEVVEGDATISGTTLTFGTVTEASSVQLKVTATVGSTSKSETKNITLNPKGSVSLEEKEAYSYIFESRAVTATGKNTLGNEEWTVSGSSTYFGYTSSSAAKGEQFGSGNNPFSTLTLNTSNSYSKVKKVVIEASTASGASATINCTVGSASSTEKTLTTSNASYTFEFSEVDGDITIVLNQTTAKALYIKSIKIYTMQ